MVDVPGDIQSQYYQNFWKSIADGTGLNSSLNVADHRAMDQAEKIDPDHKLEIKNAARSNFENGVLWADPQPIRALAAQELEKIAHDRVAEHNGDQQYLRFNEMVWSNVLHGGANGTGESLGGAIQDAEKNWGTQNGSAGQRKAFGQYMLDNFPDLAKSGAQADKIAADKSKIPAQPPELAEISKGLNDNTKSQWEGIQGYSTHAPNGEDLVNPNFKAQRISNTDANTRYVRLTATGQPNDYEHEIAYKEVKAGNQWRVVHSYGITADGQLQSLAKNAAGDWVLQSSADATDRTPGDEALTNINAPRTRQAPVAAKFDAQTVDALKKAGVTIDDKQHLTADADGNGKIQNLIAKIEGTEEYKKYSQDHHYKRPNDLIFGKGVDEVGAQMVKDGRLTQDEAKIFNALHDMGHGDGNSVGRQLAANGYHVPDAQTAEQMVAAANTQRLAAPPKSTVVAGSTTPTVVDPNANPAASSTLVPTAANGRNYRNLPNALLNNLAYQEASGANLPGVTPIQTRNALGDLVTTVTHVEGGHQVTDLYTQGPVENFSQTYVDGHRQSLVIMDKTGAVTRDFEMNEKGQLAAVKPQTPNGTVPTSTTSLASKQFPAQSTTARVVDELRAIEGTGTSGHQNNVGGYDYSGTANMVLDGRTVTLTTHTEADPSKNTWGFVERGADGREIRVSGTGNPSIDAVSQQVDQVQNAGAASSTRSVASAQPVSQSGTAQVGNPFTNVHIQSVPNGHGGLDLRGTLDLANGGGTLRVASHTERNTHGGTDLEGTVAMPDGSTLQLSAVGDSKPDKGKWLIVGHHPGTPDVKVSGTGALPPLGDIVQIDKQAQISKLAQPRV